MSQMSDFLENELVDHLFRAGTFAKPSAVWVALYTAAPSDSGGGTEVTESGSGYGRVQMGPSDTHWTATQGGTSGDSSGTAGITRNATAVGFTAPNSDWGSVVAVGIHTQASAGNLLLYGTLGASKTVNQGDPAPSFPVGSLGITFA